MLLIRTFLSIVLLAGLCYTAVHYDIGDLFGKKAKIERLKKSDEYPKELIELVKKNEETYDFVKDYPNRETYQKATIDILTIPAINSGILSEAVSRVWKEAKGVHISITEGKVSDIIQDVAARRSQLGFKSYYDTNAEFIQHELERFNLEFHSLCSNQLHVFLSKNHPLAKEPNITLSMLSPYPYIFYDGGNDPYGYTEEVFFPVHPQKSIAVSDRSSMLNIIRHSECYNLGSGWLLEGYSESDLITRPLSLPADTTMQVGWITKRGYMLDAECEQFLKFCQEALDDCCTGSL